MISKTAILSGIQSISSEFMEVDDGLAFVCEEIPFNTYQAVAPDGTTNILRTVHVLGGTERMESMAVGLQSQELQGLNPYHPEWEQAWQRLASNAYDTSFVLKHMINRWNYDNLRRFPSFRMALIEGPFLVLVSDFVSWRSEDVPLSYFDLIKNAASEKFGIVKLTLEETPHEKVIKKALKYIANNTFKSFS